jgi:hypothetical protein
MRKKYPSDITWKQIRKIQPLLEKARKKTKPSYKEWDLYTMYKLCSDWKTTLIDFSPELIPACLGQNQGPQTQYNTIDFQKFNFLRA